jgi:16S rRNA (guanine966-N2)-methyltransferase
MSRGARTVLAIEKDRGSVKFINKTLQEFDLSGAEVIIGDVFTLLNRDIGTFDIIFADPPFDEPRIKDLPDRLLKKSWLNANGTLIVEHPEQVDFSDVEGFDRQRKYGHVCFSFFSRKEA